MPQSDFLMPEATEDLQFAEEHMYDDDLYMKEKQILPTWAVQWRLPKYTEAKQIRIGKGPYR